MPAPQTILDVVSRFGDHIQNSKSCSYNETLLRRDFLDPFFKALGSAGLWRATAHWLRLSQPQLSINSVNA